MPLPTDAVRLYDSHGDVTAIVASGPSLSEPEVSLDGSFTLPTLPPLQSSTPARKQILCEAASVSPQLSDECHAVQDKEESTQEEEFAANGDTR